MSGPPSRGKEIATQAASQGSGVVESPPHEPRKRPRTEPEPSSGPKEMMEIDTTPKKDQQPTPPSVGRPPTAPKRDHREIRAPTPSVGVPPALIETLTVSRRLGLRRLVEDEYSAFTEVPINIKNLRHSLTHTFRGMMSDVFYRDRTRRVSEVNQLLSLIDQTCPDIFGRCIYARLQAISRGLNVQRGFFAERATVGHTTQIPAPIARTINSIGTFRPVDTVIDVKYVPTLGQQPDHTGGTSAYILAANWTRIYDELVSMKIPLAKIETKDLTGSSWWLLNFEERKTGSHIYDVIATLPGTNISSTDAITRTYSLSTADATNGITIIPDGMMTQRYGTILRDVHTHEPAVFMTGESDVRPDGYLEEVVT